MDITDELFRELKAKHGENLNLKDHHYFLFYQDGLFEVYLDEEESTINVEVKAMGDSAKVYFTEKKMMEELEIFGGK